ncbi:hypothetical protein TH25_24260 [Thalassospira profundimaris]|uniref:Phosphohydrolase n=1 Tax=Thalassospira profundimaris TaxID=502049 RepID=A0A367WIB2_9PROT|nr:hypothetical protein [Thalassospira profundimaris]RCK40969.1 hypothetical protein TH25_24260 [Thalassospira profundimaris]
MRDFLPAVKHPSDGQLLFARKARGLAHLRRWNGACDVSVAQHCVMACDNVSRRAAPYALIHDIEEDETGDLLTPVKQKMRELGIWHRFEVEIVLPIRKFYTELAGLNWPWPADVVAEVADIDQRLQVTEYRDAVDRDLVCGFVPRSVAPLPDYLLPWSPQKAERIFMDRAQRLFPAWEG